MSIDVKGGTTLEFRIVKREPFKLITKSALFRNEIVSDESSHDVSDFWEECGRTGVIEELAKASRSEGLYGACSPVNKESGFFSYGIGKVLEDGPVPEGFEIWEVHPELWAVFKCIGNNGDCISETWSRIYKEFLPLSDYYMLDDMDFEFYPDDNAEGVFCEVWIPVAHT